jgi:hypothetical protein
LRARLINIRIASIADAVVEARQNAWPEGCDDFSSAPPKLPQMLERDRNRDGILDLDEIEKAGPAKFDTPDRNHSGTLSRRNWGGLRLESA